MFLLRFAVIDCYFASQSLIVIKRVLLITINH